MALIRSLIFNAVALVWLFGSCLVCLPVLLFSPRYLYPLYQMWAHSVLKLLKFTTGLDYEVRGEDNITAIPSIYASKHQSAWDIIIFMALIPRSSFILKRELLLLPLMGFYMKKLKMIPINRGKGPSAMKKMLRLAKLALHARHHLIIFPEGTRTKPGAEPHYRNGIAALYTDLKVPVVPVALNSGKFWPRNSLVKRPGKITIEFFEAIQPGLTRGEFMQTLESVIENGCKQLESPSDADAASHHYQKVVNQ